MIISRFGLILFILVDIELLLSQNRQDLALFFPVTTYDSTSGWVNLQNTLAECESIAKEIQNTYGFKTEVLTNKTKKEIKDKLIELAQKKYGPQDQLLLFFSMHGYFDEAGDAGCLVPFNGSKEDPGFDTWLLHTELRTLVARIPCPHILIALDACFSGTFGGVKGIPSDPIIPDCQSKIKNALLHKSRLYLTAGGNEKVPANSIFAQKWLKALQSRGGEDGILSFTELQLRISEATTPSPRWGTFGNDSGGSFVFVLKDGCSSILDTISNAPDQTACAFARHLNTEEAWRYYYDTWINGNCWEEAKRILNRYNEDRVWQATELAQTPTEYESYKNEYCPGGQYCAEVEQRLNMLHENMVFIKGGTFNMGSLNGPEDEKPIHPITVSDYYLATHEVTVTQFRAFVEETGYKTDAEKATSMVIKEGDKSSSVVIYNWKHDSEGNAAKDNHPVVNVSWNDANKFCDWMTNKTKLKHRLPTEAEWEYAAGNGAKHTKYSWGNSEPSIYLGGNLPDKTAAKYFKWENNSFTYFTSYDDGYTTTSPVGSFNANDFCLYDMTGNVLEWCSDWYDSSYYKNSPSKNPSGPNSGKFRVCRGGSWNFYPSMCRITARGMNSPKAGVNNTGFRLAMSL